MEHSQEIRRDALPKPAAELSTQDLPFEVSAHVLMACAHSANVAPWALDPVTRNAWWSDHFFAMLGYERDGFARHSIGFRQLILPEDLEHAICSMAALAHGETTRYRAIFRLRHKDRRWTWYETTARLTDGPDGKPLDCGGLKDVQAMKDAQEERRSLLGRAERARRAAQDSLVMAEAAKSRAAEHEPVLRLSLANGKQAAWSMSLGNGGDWMMTERYELLGYGGAEFTPSAEGWRSILHPEDQNEFADRMSAAFEGRRVRRRTRSRTGRAGSVRYTPTGANGGSSVPPSPIVLADGPISSTGVISHVTADVERETALREAHETADAMRIENERLAMHDALRGLPNRRFFDRAFEERFKRAKSDQENDFCLLRVDLDEF